MDFFSRHAIVHEENGLGVCRSLKDAENQPKIITNYER